MSTDSHTRRVQAWFGPHVLCTHVADLDQAERYKRTIPFDFHGVRVNVGDTIPGEVLSRLPDDEALWPFTLK